MPSPDPLTARRDRPFAGVRQIGVILVVCLVGWMLAACGSSASISTSAGPPADQGTIPGSQSGKRLPPIIYRPATLSRSTKVPLVIALHGGGAAPVGPQNMEGLTHFERLADQNGFVVAYLDSSSQTNPWNPRTNDLPYVSHMIDQLTASQNIDPARVYITGFSAGGNETWLAGCELSRKVAAIAVVAYDMRSALYHSCRPSRPVSELLMIGDQDGVRYTGIPGRVISAFQTTARWRALDGCAPAPVSSQQVSTVLQQTWTACTDGSAVGLYVIKGGGHDWPPVGAGSPTNYSASAAIWAFFSAHRASPTSLSSDAKLSSPPVVLAVGHRTVVTTFHVGELVSVRETLLLGHRSLATDQTRLDKGTRTVTWVLSSQIRAGRYALRLVLVDAFGRRLTVTQTIRLPTPPPLSARRRQP
jgi:polyhydroxybutyrate depolymerase